MTGEVRPILLEQLEPRILLSGDGLLNIAPEPHEDTILDNTPQIVQYAELLNINEQLEEQISLELDMSDRNSDDVCKPILTLMVDGDDTEDQLLDADLNTENVGPAQTGEVLVVLSNVSDMDIESKTGTTKDNSMPNYISDADLSEEYATSIEIRGPPVRNYEHSTTSDLNTYATSDGFIEDSDVECISQLNIPNLPGLELVDHNPDNLQGQIIYIDFGGAEDVTYSEPVKIGPFNVPAFEASGELAGQEQAIIHDILGEINRIFTGSGVVFTVEKPIDGQAHSTVYVGGDDSPFQKYGQFQGLAEKVDVGNLDPTDNAFVFSDVFAREVSSTETLITRMADTIAHEIGHLLGYEHHYYPAAQEGTLSSVAVEYVVDSLLDNVEQNGELTLREALEAANTNQIVGDAVAGSDTDIDEIRFNSSLSGGVIELSGAELRISDNVRIEGPTVGMTLDAVGISRVIFVEASEVDIANLNITGGSSLYYYGGGIYNGGTLTLTNVTVSGNSRCGISNTGILTLTDTTVSGNSSDNNGGGIYNYNDGILTLTNTTVTGNSSSNYGGGIYNSNTLTLTDTTVSGNSSDYGGGIYNGGTVTLTNATVSDNYGGGIYSYDGTLTLTNTTVSGNSSDYGGGIHSYSGTLTLTNTTVSGNSSDYGGGIYNGYYASLTLTNCTVTGNWANDGVGGISNTGTATIYNTVVALNESENSSIVDVGGGLWSYGSHNFIGDASGDPGLFMQASDGSIVYYPISGSALIDAGDSSLVTESTDMLGNLRVQGGSVDIGAIEGVYDLPTSLTLISPDEGAILQASRSEPIKIGVAAPPSATFSVFLDDDGVIDGDEKLIYQDVPIGRVGVLHWNSAWSSTGTYVLTVIVNDESFITPMTGQSHFTIAHPEQVVYVVDSLADTVEVDGQLTLREALEAANTNTSIGDAVAGSSEDVDIIRFEASLAGGTIVLSSELTPLDDVIIEWLEAEALSIDAHNMSRVLSVNSDVEVVITGLLLTGGNSSDSSGGGIYNSYGTLTLTNCTVTGNSLGGSGGGIFNSGVLTLINTTVSGNYGCGISNIGTLTLTNATVSDNFGCGISSSYVNPFNATVTLTDTTVSGNSSSSGGGIYNSYVTLTLTNCTVTGNSASDSGGGIYNFNGTLTLTNTTVSGNSSNLGGGIHNFDGTLTLTDTTVSGNYGSGIHNSYGTLTLTDTMVSGNSTAGISNYGTLTLTNVTVSSNSGVGISNTGTLTLTNVTNVTVLGNSGSGILNTGTLTLTNTTVSGNSSSGNGGGIYNNTGTLILTDTTVSGNSASTYGGGIYNYNNGTLTLTNTTVSGNSSISGGGIYNSNGTLTLTNTTVTGNSASNYGGGIYNSNGTLTLTNCTVTGNWDSYGGGGVFNSGSPLTINNTVVALNESENGSPDISGVLELSSSHNFIGDALGLTGVSDGVNGNIIGGGDPLFFRNPFPGIDGQWGTADDDYGNLQLQRASPAVEAGDSSLLPPDEYDLDNDSDITEAIPFDLDGNPRIRGNAVDIGAYEAFLTPTVYEASIVAYDPQQVVRLNFSEAMDTQTFDSSEDILSFVGPGAAHVLGYIWRDDQKLDLYCLLDAYGIYTVILGPEVYSLEGNPMDADMDGICGEIDEDNSILNVAMTPPYVARHDLSTGIPVETVALSFDRPMQTGTFDPSEDIVHFMGPTGTLTVGIYRWIDSKTLELQVNQSTAGYYTLTLGPNILDRSGAALDNDGDLISGELDQDDYTITFTISSPIVVGHEAPILLPADSVTVLFNRAIDQSSFSLADDLLNFTGPDGDVEVTGFIWEDSQTLSLALNDAGTGTYSFTLGGAILDIWGNALNGDGDSIAGEGEDGYTASFTIMLHGTISEDSTIGGENSIIVVGDLLVASGVTLTVAPGTVIKFSGVSAGITVESGGKLIVEGHVDAPVILTSYLDDSVGGDTNGDGDTTVPMTYNWNGIRIESNGQLYLTNAEVRYAQTAINADSTYAKVNLTATTLRDNYRGVYVYSPSAEVIANECLIADNTSNPIFMRASSRGVFKNCTIVRNGAAIHIGAATMEFDNCIIAFNANGIDHSYSDDSQTTIRYSIFYNPSGQNLIWTSGGTMPKLDQDGNQVTAPLFVDHTVGDYRLAAGSPAIDAGLGIHTVSTDLVGNTRYDDPGMPNIGGGYPAYVDIGAFERQTATISGDLAVTSVTSPTPTFLSAGESYTVEWTVTNVGFADFDTDWQDMLYLSNDVNIDSRDTVLATLSHSGGLSVGESYAESYDGLAPATSGPWYLLVRTNADNSSVEPNLADNIGVSVRPLGIDIPIVVVGSNTSGTVASGQWQYLRLDAITGNTIALSLTGESSLKLYARRSAAPTPNDYDFVADQDGELRILNPIEDTYYIGIYSPTRLPGSHAFTVSATNTNLAIRRVTPNVIGNTGKATIEILGDNFDPNDQVQLIAPDGTIIEAEEYWQDASTMFATFDLAAVNAQADLYDLRITNGDTSQVTEIDAVTVEPGEEPEFLVDLRMPGMTRPGRVISVIVEYSNGGNIDINSPLMTISGPSDCQYQLPGRDEWIAGPELVFLALSSVGPTNVLRPGQFETIDIKVLVPLGPFDSNTLSLTISSLGTNPDDGGEQQIDWSQWYSDTTIIANLEATLGTTWGEYVNALGQVAAFYGEFGELVYSARQLAFDVALGFNPALGGSIPVVDEIPHIPTTTTVYQWNEVTDEWEIAVGAKPGSTAIIIHGWNAWLNGIAWEEWPITQPFKEMAKALEGKVNNILGVYWYSFGLKLWDPVTPAMRIPSVAKEAYEQLIALSVEPENIHIIGHSHGAHLAGLIGNLFAQYGMKIKRITALDASEEQSHRLTIGNYMGRRWGPNSAEFVDFYKSSKWFGGETAWGHDNFVLVPPDRQWGTERGDLNPVGDHGYAISWYIMTIQNATPGGGDYELGYNWNKDSWDSVIKVLPGYPDTQIPNEPWKGIIRGQDVINAIECLTIGIDFDNNNDWLYPGAWPGSYDDSLAIKFMLCDLASAVEMRVTEVNVSNNIWQTGGQGVVDYTIENHADNLSVTKNLRVAAQLGLDFPGCDMWSLGPIQDWFWLSQDEILDAGDYPLKSVKYHSYDSDFLGNSSDGSRSQTYTKEITMPGEDDILSWWGDDSLAPEYYLIVDAGSSNALRGRYLGELYPANNYRAVSISFEGNALSADAGSYPVFLDEDRDGLETVILDGSASAPENEIVFYEWSIGLNGKVVQYDYPTGRYEVFLTVTDINGNTDTDSAIIVVKKSSKPPGGSTTGTGTTGIGTSYTPEDKFGPGGYDPMDMVIGQEQRFVRSNQPLSYRVEFWNKEDAIVPTQDAIIIDELDPNLFDLSTLEFTRIGFLDWDVMLVSGQVIDMRIDCRPEMNIAVEIKAGLGIEIPGFVNNADINENTLVWWFHCIDPLTGEWPEDPMAGFLPPYNPATGFEIGWVEFTVDPVVGLPTGTELANVAYVEFDFAGDIYDHPAPKVDPDIEPAEPKPWINTIDADAPESSVAALASTQYYNLFMVNWSGTDVGSGVATYDIYVREDDGPWALWLDATAETIGWYTGRSGHNYGFYSVVHDNVGNVEDAPAEMVPDAVTTIEAAVELELGSDVGLIEGDTFSLTGAVGNMVPKSTATVNYGDGTSVESLTLGGDSSFDLLRVYPDDDLYTVVVSVSDPYGTTVSDTLLVTVENAAPVAHAGGDQTANEGEMLTFSGSFADAGTHDTHEFQWDFGDGSTISGILDPSHVYANNGVYTVMVTVTDDDGASTSDTLTVTVENVAPTVIAGTDQTVDKGSVVSLDPATFNDLGTLDTHTAVIDWGDGTSPDAGIVTESPFGPPGSTSGADGTVSGSHVYADDGIYTVTVTVTDDNNDSGSDTLTITVNEVNVPPVLADIEVTSLSYTENDGPVAITGTITVSDVDDTHLESAVIQIAVNYQNGQDVLAFTDTANISGSWDAANGTLTLTGTETLANYQVALHSVTYENTSANPSDLTRTVSFAVNDGDADSNTATRDITIDAVGPSQLRVDSLEVIPSGFIAHFNRQIDPDVLNLYDTEAGIYGPADFTVVGNTVGPVAGSLICNEDGTIVSFIKTGGSLEPDTYLVTLHSADIGFKDSEGHLLDGDADDVEGGDYVTTVTVEPTTARLLSLPDFTRGPGQDVNVPAIGPGIPVTINDGSDILSVNFAFDYDLTLLIVTGVSLASGLPNDWVLTYNLGTPGHVSVTVYGPTPLSAGEVRLVQVEANVPDNAPYRSAAILSLSNIQINDGSIALRADCAIQVVAYFGDATGNHTYSGLDAAYIARVAVGLDSGFATYRLKDPVIVADVTGNGRFSGLDAAYVARKAVGLEQPEIPDLPEPLPGIIAGGRDPLLSISEGLTAQRGSTVTVPILVDDATDLFLADIDLQYDTNVFDLSDSGVNPGALTTGWSLISNVDNVDGRVRLSAYNTSALSSGFGSIVELEFNVRSDAVLGVTVIDLLESCSLNEGGLVLTLQDGEVGIQDAITIPTLLAWKLNDDTDVSLAGKLSYLVDREIAVLSNDSDGDIESRVSTTKKDDTPQLYVNYNEIGIEETTSIGVRGPYWAKLVLKTQYVSAQKAKDRKLIRLILDKYVEKVQLSITLNISRLSLVLRSSQPE